MDIEDILKKDFGIDINKHPNKIDINKHLNKLMYKKAGKKLVQRMNEVFEDKDTAQRWFYTKLIPFENKRPYDYCLEGRSEEIFDVLMRMEHGIPS